MEQKKKKLRNMSRSPRAPTPRMTTHIVGRSCMRCHITCTDVGFTESPDLSGHARSSAASPSRRIMSWRTGTSSASR